MTPPAARPTTAPTAPPAHLLAPTGTLRVVINLGNPVLAQGTPDDPRGVSVAIARATAGWLRVPLVLECVQAARDAYAAMAGRAVDLCFLADEPAREEHLRFTPAYVVIDGVYVADPGSALRGAADVDRAGVRIGVRRGSAYDLFLTRTVQQAEVVRGDEAVDVYEGQGLDVLAGVRQPLEQYAADTGRRVLEPAFMQIRQAVGLPRDVDGSALAAVSAFVEHLRSSGFVRRELERSGVRATVASAGS